MNPIDYSIQNAVDPSQAFMQALGQGMQVRQYQQQQLQAQQQQAAALEAQQRVQYVLSNPNATHDDLMAVMQYMDPKVSAEILKAREAAGKEKAQAALGHGMQVIAALRNGAPDVAVQLLNERADALENSGRMQEAAKFRDMAERAKTDPTGTANLIGVGVAGLPGAKEAFDSLAKQGEEARAAQLQPYAVREKAAGATSAEAKATVDAASAPALIRKNAADATKAEGDAVVATETAKIAPQTAALSLKKAAADIGLSGAQAAQAMAHAKKLNVETQQLVAEAASGGDPKVRFEAEQKLRKEYYDQTKPFSEVTEAYRRIKSVENNGAGDIALIYSYMKMLDPGSVVREGEFATAQNSAGIPAAIQNVYNKALNGERLTEGQRKTFLSQAGKLAESASKREAEVRGGLSTVVKAYNLSADNVFGTGIVKDPADAWAANKPAAAPKATTGGATVSRW